ncbi:MAG: DUF3473 domain-containing protein [Planctomycetota bacterium]
MPANHLTIDVEEYFEQAPPEVAGKCESRLEGQLDKVLQLLDETGNRATFFFLARLATMYPSYVKRVASSGHRIGCHGNEHVFLNRLPFEEQVASVRTSIRAVRDSFDGIVESFRAPFFSIVGSNRRLLDVLAEENVRFDCSVFPGMHPDYGWPGTPSTPYRVKLSGGREIAEVPVTTSEILGLRFGVGGGGWLRMLPWAVTRRILRGQSLQGNPIIIYLHPWELDPEQPRLKLGMRFPWRHYLNLEATESRFREILTTYRFVPVEEIALDVLPSFALDELGKTPRR